MDQNGILAKAEDGSKDWINKLPNCILSSIVSLLTIKDAVDTSMISRQWRNIWLQAVLTRPNLEFDIPNIFGSRYVGPSYTDYFQTSHAAMMDQRKREVFISRVNKFLQLYRGKKVDSFKVAFFLDGKSAATLDEWIRFAITKGVEDLDLHLFGCSAPRLEYYAFPCWLLSELNASTLKHLSLSRCVLRPPPDFDRFNQLKTLNLNNAFVNEKVMAHLISVCVFLESLTLMLCRVGSVLIVGPLLHLTDLKLIYCRNIRHIKISAVNLVSLEYVGDIEKISFINTLRLARIYFRVNIKATFGYALTQFATFPGLETLHLHLHLGVELPQSVPTFRNLKKLDLDVLTYIGSRDDIDLTCVLNLLKGTPLLEELVMMVGGRKFRENQREMRDLPGFTHDHLKKVKIQGFQSNSFEIEFAICILRHSKMLEMMVIDPLGKLYMGEQWMEASRLSGLNPFWEENRRAFVEEKLKAVKTNAQVIIL